MPIPRITRIRPAVAHRVSVGVGALALAMDLLQGELPAAVHPVVWLGQAIEFGPRRWRGEQGAGARLKGGAASAAIVLGAGVAAGLLDRSLRASTLPGVPVLRATLLAPSFALKSLIDAADYVARPLEDGDLDAARQGLGWLCSRDPSNLEATDLLRATIASLAENSCDSVVAPWLAWSFGGAGWAWAFRAINTLDAMIGYRGEWDDVGRFAARLDDVAHYVPARVSGLLIVLCAPLGGGSARDAWRVMWRDHALTESPNGGWPMAAMAGALGVRIDKPGHYALLAEGRDATTDDVRKAQKIAWFAMVSSVGLALAIAHRRGR